MKATFRVLFLLILLTAVRTSAGFASASPAISCPNDTTRVLTRLPLNSSIEKFNSDPEFQYKKTLHLKPIGGEILAMGLQIV